MDNPLVAQLIAVLREHKEDSFESRRKRFYELRQVLDTLQARYGLQRLQNLSRKHVNQVVAEWKSSALTPRTIANKLTYLRWLVHKIGKPNLLPRSNADLGLEAGARHTKAGHVVPADYLADLLGKAEGDPKVKAMLLLGRYLGLRFKEASLFRPGRDWQGDRVYIKRGTKGGRPRYLWVASSQQREVLQFVAGLVDGKDGCLIPQEAGTYRNWKQQTYEKLRALGLGRKLSYEFHDLRRTFINEEIKRLIGKGHAASTAAKLVAKAVGHNRTEVLRWYMT